MHYVFGKKLAPGPSRRSVAFIPLYFSRLSSLFRCLSSSSTCLFRQERERERERENKKKWKDGRFQLIYLVHFSLFKASPLAFLSYRHSSAKDARRFEYNVDNEEERQVSYVYGDFLGNDCGMYARMHFGLWSAHILTVQKNEIRVATGSHISSFIALKTLSG